MIDLIKAIKARREEKARELYDMVGRYTELDYDQWFLRVRGWRRWDRLCTFGELLEFLGNMAAVTIALTLTVAICTVFLVRVGLLPPFPWM